MRRTASSARVSRLSVSDDYDTICFDECFLFHVITGRHYFLYKFIITQRFGETAMLLCSLKQVFWKKPAFYIRFLLNNFSPQFLANNKGPQQNFYFLSLLILFFLLFQIVNVPHFPLWMEHLKLKSSKALIRHVFIKSYTQIFMMYICFYKLLQISEEKNREHLTPIAM